MPLKLLKRKLKTLKNPAYNEQRLNPNINSYRKAANQGDAEAQFNLGLTYKEGQEVQQDNKMAAKWYQKAAEQGHITAQFNLGLLYQDGKGVEQDFASAVKWYQKAAQQDHITAQFNLGLLYQDGKGIRQNKTNAKEWYGRACDGGLQLGCDSYRELNEQGY